MTALVDLHRLARVCGLFGSEHDGEVLAAARQAEKIRKKLGVTWEELLVPSPRPRAADPPPEDLTDWRWACHFCLERYWLLLRRRANRRHVATLLRKKSSCFTGLFGSLALAEGMRLTVSLVTHQ